MILEPHTTNQNQITWPNFWQKKRQDNIINVSHHVIKISCSTIQTSPNCHMTNTTGCMHSRQKITTYKVFVIEKDYMIRWLGCREANWQQWDTGKTNNRKNSKPGFQKYFQILQSLTNDHGCSMPRVCEQNS